MSERADGPSEFRTFIKCKQTTTATTEKIVRIELAVKRMTTDILYLFTCNNDNTDSTTNVAYRCRVYVAGFI